MKKLTGNTEIEDSLSRLDKLTQEEARMASAELLKVTHGVDGKVMGVDDRVKDVQDAVQDVRGDVQDISSEIRGVDNKLDQVNRSLSLLYLIILGPHTASQRTTSEIVFYDGSRPQIHLPIITLRAKLIIMARLSGSFKAVYSIDGNPPTRSYGYTENVCYS